MRFALLAGFAVAAAMSVPANAAVNVTINATAYGTFSIICTIPSQACIDPVYVAPISRSFTYTFQVASVTDGASFSFNDYTPSIADPAFVSGTFKKQANGGYSGINFWYYQDNYVESAEAIPNSMFFHIGRGQFDPQYEGTITRVGNGQWVGTNLVFTQRTGQYEDYFLTAPTFQVFQITPTPAPEPATWAMIISGFGAIGGAMRYRRRKTMVSFA